MNSLLPFRRGGILSLAIIGALLLGACVGSPGSLSKLIQSGAITAQGGSIQPAGNGVSFQFTGQVQSIGSSEWVVSGIPVPISASTQIDAGITVGDRVQVSGSLSDGVVTVSSIKLAGTSTATATEAAAMTGTPEMSETPEVTETPSATETETETATVEVSSTPAASLTPQVSHTPMPGGTFEFKGTVSAINGSVWTINGKMVTVDGSTKIEDNPMVGDFVEVKVTVQSDGTLLALKIEKEDMGNENNDENNEDNEDHSGFTSTPEGNPFTSTPSFSSTPHEDDEQHASSTPVPGGDSEGDHTGGGHND